LRVVRRFGAAAASSPPAASSSAAAVAAFDRLDVVRDFDAVDDRARVVFFAGASSASAVAGAVSADAAVLVRVVRRFGAERPPSRPQ
jgi:hypothetical protein